jgi:demethylmenaquinone methyltransferase / 2-methoxy-6-polyprenyl-1,4-benzoquinol methylase
MCRVLKPGGTLIVLEFSKPSAFPMKQLYSFYFSQILPMWGGWISKDKEAYSYLPASVLQFPEGQQFDDEIQRAGLVPVRDVGGKPVALLPFMYPKSLCNNFLVCAF